MELVASKYPRIVSVTLEAAIFPKTLEINTLDAVKSEVVIVLAPPVIAFCLELNVVQSVLDKYPL
jgi:hypothetical protein